jgi:pimeloyl-ACP methyl ester carboxylesterase
MSYPNNDTALEKRDTAGGSGHLYCLSGLGADHRIFDKLSVPSKQLVALDWLVPQAKSEQLNDYARRLAANISEELPVLVGVSFGGMMAIEIAKHIPVKAVILISSVKNYHELPTWMRVFGKCKADLLLPNVPLKKIRPLRTIRPIQNYFLGAKSSEQIAIANEFRDNVDPLYLKWSVRQIFTWRNEWNPPNLYHIHGDNDKLFPLKKLQPTHVIPRGGHFMVMTHFNEVNQIIRDICKKL